VPNLSRRRFISGLFAAGAATQLPAVRAFAASGATPSEWDPNASYAKDARVTYRGQTWRAVSNAVRGQYPQGVGDGSRADRDLLLAQRNGFAQAVTGGDAGSTYVVTSTADTSTPGTLRHALTRPVPVWIVFDKSLGPNITITLGSKLKPSANKTVDGRGVSVTITGSYDMSIKGLGTANHIWAYIDRIVAPVAAGFSGSHDFSVDGTPAKGAPAGFDQLWLHHVGLGQNGDDLVVMAKAGAGPSRTTVDWCRFGPTPDLDAWLFAYNAHTLGQDNSADNGKSALFGLDPQDGAAPDSIQATFHHNHIHGAVQRNVKVQRGRAHFYNNLVDRWGYPPLVTSPADAKNHPDAQNYAATYQSGMKKSAVNPNYGPAATEIGPDGELLSQNNVYAPYALKEEHVLSAALVSQGYLSTPWLVTAPATIAMRRYPVKPNPSLPDPLVRSAGNWSPAGALTDLNLSVHPEQVFTGITYASDVSPYGAIGSGQTRAAGDDWRNDAPYSYDLSTADAQLHVDLENGTGNAQAWVLDA
jgi:pectate lyase